MTVPLESSRLDASIAWKCSAAIVRRTPSSADRTRIVAGSRFVVIVWSERRLDAAVQARDVGFGIEAASSDRYVLPSALKQTGRKRLEKNPEHLIGIKKPDLQPCCGPSRRRRGFGPRYRFCDKSRRSPSFLRHPACPSRPKSEIHSRWIATSVHSHTPFFTVAEISSWNLLCSQIQSQGFKICDLICVVRFDKGFDGCLDFLHYSGIYDWMVSTVFCRPNWSTDL